jgi:hypothetical protein
MCLPRKKYRKLPAPKILHRARLKKPNDSPQAARHRNKRLRRFGRLWLHHFWRHLNTMRRIKPNARFQLRRQFEILWSLQLCGLVRRASPTLGHAWRSTRGRVRRGGGPATWKSWRFWEVQCNGTAPSRGFDRPSIRCRLRHRLCCGLRRSGRNFAGETTKSPEI